MTSFLKYFWHFSSRKLKPIIKTLNKNNKMRMPTDISQNQ